MAESPFKLVLLYVPCLGRPTDFSDAHFSVWTQKRLPCAVVQQSEEDEPIACLTILPPKKEKQLNHLLCLYVLKRTQKYKHCIQIELNIN